MEKTSTKNAQIPPFLRGLPIDNVRMSDCFYRELLKSPSSSKFTEEYACISKIFQNVQ